MIFKNCFEILPLNLSFYDGIHEKIGLFDLSKLKDDLVLAIFKFWLLQNRRNIIFNEINQLNLEKIKDLSIEQTLKKISEKITITYISVLTT